jgi:hypothetical protein
VHSRREEARRYPMGSWGKKPYSPHHDSLINSRLTVGPLDFFRSDGIRHNVDQRLTATSRLVEPSGRRLVPRRHGILRGKIAVLNSFPLILLLRISRSRHLQILFSKSSLLGCSLVCQSVPSSTHIEPSFGSLCPCESRYFNCVMRAATH